MFTSVIAFIPTLIFHQVMELLVHLNKRIKSRPKIQLPVETLLVQYQDPAAASFVTNFTIIYIKMGYPRLETSKQCELAPTLLTAMEGKPQPQQDRLGSGPPSRSTPVQRLIHMQYIHSLANVQTHSHTYTLCHSPSL